METEVVEPEATVTVQWDKPYVNRGITDQVNGYVHKDDTYYRNDGHKHLKSFGNLT